MTLPFTHADLLAAVAAGHVSEKIAESTGLRLYNYTPTAQWGRIWTPVTLACRGLVLDEHGDPVARAFPKFFNLGEHEPDGYRPPLPDGPLTATEKWDGSLGIVFHHGGRWRCATRGSFDSEQARKGEAMLDPAGLDPACTYAYEIIYPGNRVVVDYRGAERMVPLSVFVTATGEEVGGPVHVQCFGNLDEFRAYVAPLQGQENREGWVLRWGCGTRAKFKLPRYVEIHRLLDHLSPRVIWEWLSAGEDTDARLSLLPDEMHEDFRVIRDGIREDYERLCARHAAAFGSLDLDDMTRKEQAALILAAASDHDCNPGVLFTLLDGKDPSAKIWRMAQP